MSGIVSRVEPRVSNAALVGLKMVMSGIVDIRFKILVLARAPAKAVRLNWAVVSTRLAGGVRKVSMMWTMPLEYLRSGVVSVLREPRPLVKIVTLSDCWTAPITCPVVTLAKVELSSPVGRKEKLLLKEFAGYTSFSTWYSRTARIASVLLTLKALLNPEYGILAKASLLGTKMVISSWLRGPEVEMFRAGESRLNKSG